MTESLRIMKHMHRLGRHVERRLKTTEVWESMFRGEIPNGDYPPDVREAITKLNRLKHRYDQLWMRRTGGVKRTGTAPWNDYCTAMIVTADHFVMKWVMSMWRKGDWSVIWKDDKGNERSLKSCDGREFRWTCDRRVDEVKSPQTDNRTNLSGLEPRKEII